MKFSLLLFATFWMFSCVTCAQTLTGKIIDAQTKLPLSYVHIGILNRNMGVISRDDGTFEIDLSRAKKDDELIFSMLGYEVQTWKVDDLPSYLVLTLAPKARVLREVVVRDKKIKPVKLGRYATSKTTTGQSGKEEFGFGGEWGLKISNQRKNYWLEDVFFHLRFNTVDSVLFRIQVYSVKDEMPFESLLSKDAFVKSHSGQKWIGCDLRDEYLVFDQPVVVTYEVVRIWWSKKTDNQLFFTHGSGYAEGRSYSRASSQDRWMVEMSPPVAMYLSCIPYE